MKKYLNYLALFFLGIIIGFRLSKILNQNPFVVDYFLAATLFFGILNLSSPWLKALQKKRKILVFLYVVSNFLFSLLFGYYLLQKNYLIACLFLFGLCISFIQIYLWQKSKPNPS